MADNTANVYTKEQADSAFASKSHTHSSYISASSLVTTVFTGSFTDRSYFTCYIPGMQFHDWKSLLRWLDQQCTSFSNSLGCWGLLTNSSGQSFSIIGLHFNNGIVFDCQGPAGNIGVSHPMQGGSWLSGRYSMGIWNTARASNTSWLLTNQNIPTSFN